ncbi:MAG: tetratricopeptide repeat protein [Saprospiraceae bacterium]|nr:tetratricopeptide repeat protein [Saprospiraceae bacterium]
MYRHTGKPDLAEQVNLNVLGIRKKTMGKGHEDYAQSLVNLIYLYLETEQKDKAIPYTLELADNIRHRLQVAFSFLSDREKEGFIRAKLEDQVALLQTAGVAIGTSQAGDMLYDLSLMMKGVRLQSGISTMAYVLEQQDTSTIGIYRNLLAMRNQLARQYELPVDQRSGIEQMEDQLDQMEKKLARLSASFRRDQAKSKLTHREVKTALKPGELAIEFIQIPELESVHSEGARYAALVLSPQTSHVQVVPLCSEEQLQTLLNGSSERRLDYVNELYSIADRGFFPLKKLEQDCTTSSGDR